MVIKSKTDAELSKHVTYDLPENYTDDRSESKQNKYVGVKKRVSKINTIVKSLEKSLVKSDMYDTKLINSMQLDKLKLESNNNMLEKARKENKQLLNVLQKQNSDNSLSRSSSRTQMDNSSSYGTCSLVHLQYKYEELLSSQEGLLKLLESKVKEAKKCYRENDHLREETVATKEKLDEHIGIVASMTEKYVQLKKRKDSKIEKLKCERDTLKLSHDKLLSLLHEKSLETDEILTQELLKSTSSRNSLLLNEIRRSNMLQHENSKLIREIAYLKGNQHKNVNITDHLKQK